MAEFEEFWRYGWSSSLHSRPTFQLAAFIATTLRYQIYVARCRHLYDGDPAPTGTGIWLAAGPIIKHQLAAAASLGDSAICLALSNGGHWLRNRGGRREVAL